jgi:ribosome-associated protein
MNPEEIKNRIPRSEIIFSTSRSAGPGGQNVNKVNTKVELRFNVLKSQCLSENEKKRILSLLKKRITSDGEFYITSQSERTQLMNKKKVEERFYKLLASSLTEKPKRKSTKPTKASKTKRLERKKKRGSVKRLRKD